MICIIVVLLLNSRNNNNARDYYKKGYHIMKIVKVCVVNNGHLSIVDLFNKAMEKLSDDVYLPDIISIKPKYGNLHMKDEFCEITAQVRN